MSPRQLIVTSVLVGVVAAAVVWFLERYQAELLAMKFQQVLRSHDAFNEWLRQQQEGRGSGEST